MLIAQRSAVATRSSARPNRRRHLAVLVLVTAAVVSLLPATRHRVLRLAGWALVAEDPLVAADAIVVSVDAGQAGVLEAADLVRRGLAARVALLEQEPTPAERELVRRGVAYESRAATSEKYLKLLGVSDVERIAGGVDSTRAEGLALRNWCARRQFRSVIVVSSADHSRRLRRVMKRAMRGAPARVVVRVSHFSAFDPDSWWLSRTGIRTQIVETEKLLLDIASHPWP
jgi:uncharacterized SAM-binding protein YcdF (DUF218 family)